MVLMSLGRLPHRLRLYGRIPVSYTHLDVYKRQVLTPEYAARIGADFYSADAKQAVDIARRVLGE